MNKMQSPVDLLETAQNHINGMTLNELGMTAKEKHTILQDISKIRRLIKSRSKKSCGTCGFYYKEHCCNGASDECTEMVDEKMSCDKWEGKDVISETT